jgi:hypothetical protein
MCRVSTSELSMNISHFPELRNIINVHVISGKRSLGKCDSGKRVYGELCFRGNCPQRKGQRGNETRGIGPRENNNYWEPYDSQGNVCVCAATR